MENDNFTEVINIRRITELVLEYLDSSGFTTDVPIDPELLRQSVDEIIRAEIEDQGVRTYTFGSE